MSTRYASRLEQPADGSIEPEFQELFTTIAGTLAAVAEMLDLPAVQVTAVMTDDYRGEVERAWKASEAIDESEDGTYTVDRVGGIAVAKTIPMTNDRSRFRVVFDGTQLGPASDPAAQAVSVLLIAHELTHPLVDRLRWASGAMDGVPMPSRTPFEVARSMVRVAVDEMWADAAANIVLSAMGTAIGQDGQTRPMNIVDAIGDHQRIAVGEVLDSVIHPGWPDLVRSYQMRQIPLERLWSTIGTQTDQTVTMLAHVQAQAMATQRPGPLEAEFAEHPGTRLYLGPMWKRILDTLGDGRLPVLSEFRDAELALLDEGEKAITDMWKRLGLTFDPKPGRAFYIHVTDPAW